MNNLKIKTLFECNGNLLYRFFDSFEYPWHVLPKINSFIFEIIKNIDGYIRLKEDVYIGKNVKISSLSTIEGPAIIGDFTEIRCGAYIRENVIVGDNCVIGNSTELKNCILLNNVSAPHYNYIGDSILGNNVHLGAGVICSNLRTDGKNVKIKSVDCVETGMRKVGAFIGDGADIGCNCVLNPGTIIGNETDVYPSNVLSGIYPPYSIVKSNGTIKRKD